MKKTINADFVFRALGGYRPILSRVVVRTATFNKKPAFCVELKREYFPGRYENHATLKAGVIDNDAAKRAVTAAAAVLKRAAESGEGRAVYSYFVNRVYGEKDVEAYEGILRDFDRLLIEEARNYTE